MKPTTKTSEDIIEYRYANALPPKDVEAPCPECGDFHDYQLTFFRIVAPFEVDGVVYTPPMTTDRNSGVRPLYNHSWKPVFNLKGDTESSETVGFRWWPYTDRNTAGLFGADPEPYDAFLDQEFGRAA